MKQYTKPVVSVVELSVKENIAKLPNAIQSFSGVETTNISSASGVILTTYNLATTSESTVLEG